MTADVVLVWTDPNSATHTVTLKATQIDEDVSKNWKINAIPNPSSRWAKTALSGQASATDTHIDVTAASGVDFAANDEIFISGYDTASPPVAHSERATISSVATDVLNLKAALKYTYVAANSSVIRIGRSISLDFNQVVNSVTINGVVTGVGVTGAAGMVKNTLLDMAQGGGSIDVTYDNKHNPNMAITKLNVRRVAESEDPPTSYDVILNLTSSSVELGK